MPPMPMPVTLNRSVAGNDSVRAAKPAPRSWTKPTLFTVNCPECSKTLKGVPALAIKVDNRHWMTNGIRIERTVRLACPDCREEFDAANVKFLPKPIAIEEGDQPQASVKSLDVVNPMLRLSIKLTNCIPPGAAEGPAVELSFQTEFGKLYECQASDDNFQSWLGSVPLAGTGTVLSRFESPSHTHRMYRVKETTL